jgi:hypothetical protein
MTLIILAKIIFLDFVYIVNLYRSQPPVQNDEDDLAKIFLGILNETQFSRMLFSKGGTTS